MPTHSEQLAYIAVSIRKKLKLFFIMIITGMLISYSFIDDLIIMIKEDLLPTGAVLIQISPVELIILKFKISLVAGMVPVIPILLYTVYMALKDQLDIQTRVTTSKIVLTFVSAVTLFILGVAYSYYFMLPLFLGFLYATSSNIVNATYSIQEFISFIVTMTLLISVSFELPLLIIFAVRSGIVTLESVKIYRRHAYVAIFVMAALFTPPDVFSQIIVGSPVIIFYEVGVALAGLGYKNKFQ